MAFVPQWLTRVPGVAWLGRHWKPVVHGLTLVVAVSFLIKLSAADEWYWSKFFFYLPAPVLGVLGLVLALAPGGFSWRARAAFVPLFLLLGTASLWIEHPALFRPAESVSISSPELRVVTWNVMAYWLNEEGVYEDLAALNPDVLVLVEGTFRQRKPEKLAKALGPGYDWAVGSRLSVASRFRIVESRMLADDGGAKVFVTTLDLGGGKLDVVAVDLYSPRVRNDHTAFAALAGALEDVRETTIVAGDFNTPRGSRHLSRTMDGWRDDVRQASDARWQASWPSPLPLWQIDHSFSRGKVVPLAADLPWGLSSDHLPVVVDYAITFPVK